MKVREEQCLKSKTIRVWTSKNFNLEPEVELICKLDETKILNHVPDSSKIISEFVDSAASGELADHAKLEDILVGAELSSVSPRNTESNFVETSTDLQDLVLDQRGTISQCKLVCSSVDVDSEPSGALPSDVLKPFSTGSYKRNANLSLSADNTRRANRILERLKVCLSSSS